MRDGLLIRGLLIRGLGICRLLKPALRRLARHRDGLRALAAPHRLCRDGLRRRTGCGSSDGRGLQHRGRSERAGGGVPLPLDHEVDHLVLLRLVGALAPEARPLAGGRRRPCRLLGHPRAHVVGLREHDLRPFPLGRVGQEEAARPQPPLVLAEFAEVEDVAGPEREPVEHRAVPRVRMVAADPHVDLAHAIPLPLLDVVDEVELARRLEEAWIGSHVGEDEPAAAVDVADQVEVGVHLGLVEVFAPLELDVALEELRLELAVADERHVAHGVPRPLVDDEREARPVTIAFVHHLHLAAHLRLKEAEAAVVGRERLHVLIDHLAVDVAANDPEDAGLRLDLREQPGIAGDRVAHEAGPERLASLPLVDEEHGPLVARLAPLDGRHAGRVVALLVVIRLDPAAGLLDDVRIHRVADVDLALLLERAVGDRAIADVLHVAEHRPLDHLEDHDHALGHPQIFRMDVDELPRAMQRADVLLDRLRIEDLAGPGDEFGKLRGLGGVVALDSHLDDPVGGVAGSDLRQRLDRRQRDRRGGVSRQLAAGRGCRQQAGPGQRRPERHDNGRANAGRNAEVHQVRHCRGGSAKPWRNSGAPFAVTSRKVSFRGRLAQTAILDWPAQTAVPFEVRSAVCP